MKNIGLYYYKEYYEGINFIVEESAVLEETNAALFDEKLTDYSAYISSTLDSLPANHRFQLKTTYPGLLIGSGYMHETGATNELKLGFFFDYTTGLPCIPGSSIKGVLRHACEVNDGNYVRWILEEGLKEINASPEVLSLAENFLQEEKHAMDGENSKLLSQVFEGKVDEKEYLPPAKRDIFFDAFPEETFHPDGKFLANDFITPHKDDPLKNPIPIQFLKVLPEVVFQFNFKLTDNIMPAALKEAVFKHILLDLGVGAKTNVGYGQFSEISKEQIKNAEIEKIALAEKNRKQNEADRRESLKLGSSELQEIESVIGFDEKPGYPNLYEGEIVKENEEYFLFKVEQVYLLKRRQLVEDKTKKDAERNKNKSKPHNYPAYSKGVKVKIRVNKKTGENFNFTVLPYWTK